jgi:glycosyltransferase involved in cell wall biosynthesis
VRTMDETISKSPKLKIIAGMPAYNEGNYIGTMVLNTRQYVDEVIVVNDGSTDNTAEIARLAGAEVVQHPQNRGYGAAIQSIFAEARKKDPDILVILDADAQHDPREIPKIIEPIRAGYDFVIGSRRKQAGSIPLYRRLGQRLILRSVGVLSQNQLTDSECGFRAFSRKAIETLDLRENGMAVSAETVAEVLRKNLKVTEVPISVIYNKDGSTMNPVTHGLGVLTKIVIMISERRPLFFFGLAGTLLAIVGMIAGIIALRLYSNSGIVSVGWTLLTIFFIIIGTISFFTGLTLRSISGIIRSALTKDTK